MIRNFSDNNGYIMNCNVLGCIMKSKFHFQSFDGDLHLVPLTPITGRRYTINRPNIGTTPLTVVTSGLQKLYALLAGRKNSASEELQEMFK